jgi:hypothetical protein
VIGLLVAGISCDSQPLRHTHNRWTFRQSETDRTSDKQDLNAKSERTPDQTDQGANDQEPPSFTARTFGMLSMLQRGIHNFNDPGEPNVFSEWVFMDYPIQNLTAPCSGLWAGTKMARAFSVHGRVTQATQLLHQTQLPQVIPDVRQIMCQNPNVRATLGR